MLRKSACLLAFGASIVTAVPAAACCGCVSACAPAPVVHRHLAPVYRPYREPIYVVNQGPVYSGPNIMLVPGAWQDETTPAVYPYIGHDYYRPSYRWRHGLMYPRARRWHGVRIGHFDK